MHDVKNLILNLESDLDELEKIVKEKLNLLTQVFNTDDSDVFLSLITKVREITSKREFEVIKDGITDFNTLKNYLTADVSSKHLKLIKVLQTRLSELKELFENEVSHENAEQNKQVIIREVRILRNELDLIHDEKGNLNELVKYFNLPTSQRGEISEAELKERESYLIKLELPLDKLTKSQINFLCKNVFDVYALGKQAGKNAEDFYGYSIPAIVSCIEKYPDLWPKIGYELVEMGEKARKNARYLYREGIPAIMSCIEKYPDLWPKIGYELVDMGKRARKNARYLYREGIPAIVSYIEKHPDLWPKIRYELVKVGKKAGKNAEDFYGYGIPAIMSCIEKYPDSWPKIGYELMEMGKQAGKNAWDFYKYGVPAIMSCIEKYPDSWPKIRYELVEVGKKVGKNAEDFYGYGIPAIMSCIEKYPDLWPKIGYELVDMGKRARKNARYFYEHGISAIVSYIEKYPDSWPKIRYELVDMGKNAEDFYGYGIPAIMSCMEKYPDLWPKIGYELVDMGKQTGKNVRDFYEHRVPAIMSCMEKYPDLWPKIGYELVDMGKQAGKNVRDFYEHGVPAIMSCMEKYPDLWPKIGYELVDVGKPAGKNVRDLYKYGIPAIFPFTNIENLSLIFRFIKNQIQGSRKKIKILSNLSKFSNSEDIKYVIWHYLEYKQKSLLDFISNINLVTEINLIIDLNWISSIAKPLKYMSQEERDFIFSENPKTGNKLIEDYYLKLLELNNSYPDKKRASFTRALSQIKDIKNIPTGSLNNLQEVFAKELINYFDNMLNRKIKIKIGNEFGKIEIDEEELRSEIFIEVYKMYFSTSKNRDYAKELLTEYTHKNCYPHKSNKILNCYPYTKDKNKTWIEETFSNEQREIWFSENKRVITIQNYQNNSSTNTSERISHHLNDANSILEKLGFDTCTDAGNLINYFNSIVKKKESEIHGNLFNDLKLQVNSILKLVRDRKAVKIDEITIYRELNPLRVLMMGNWVVGSCLSYYSNAKNYWSCFTNALEANKAVFYIESENRIIGRVLVAIDNHKNIVRFPLYYSGNIIVDLNPYFDAYITDLAKKCSLGINGNVSNVKLLFCDEWYSDLERQIYNL